MPEIRHLDTAVQGALLADDPQAAVTALIKRWAAQMAGDILVLEVYEHRIAGGQVLVDCLHLEDARAVLAEWGIP